MELYHLYFSSYIRIYNTKARYPKWIKKTDKTFRWAKTKRVKDDCLRQFYNQSDIKSTDLINNLKQISKKANMILYRDKENSNYSKFARVFIEEAKKFNFDKILFIKI